MKGVGRTAWAFRTEKESTGNDTSDDECGGNDIFIDGFWEKWDALFFQDGGIFLVVSLTTNDHSRNGVFIDTFGEDHAEVEAHEGNDGTRQDEDMECEEA